MNDDDWKALFEGCNWHSLPSLLDDCNADLEAELTQLIRRAFIQGYHAGYKSSQIARKASNWVYNDRFGVEEGNDTQKDKGGLEC